MANEATVRSGLTIRKLTGAAIHIDHNKQRTFRANIAGEKGPCVGAISAAVAGTDVDLSELDQAGLCCFTNQDDTNYVTGGIWDGEFHPLFELLPGESYVMRLSRLLTFEYGAGTGTTGSGNTLRFKASTAPVNVLVEAFET